MDLGVRTSVVFNIILKDTEKTVWWTSMTDPNVGPRCLSVPSKLTVDRWSDISLLWCIQMFFFNYRLTGIINVLLMAILPFGSEIVRSHNERRISVATSQAYRPAMTLGLQSLGRTIRRGRCPTVFCANVLSNLQCQTTACFFGWLKLC